MTANSSTAYPAEYYYPEFIDNRPDDPLKPPPTNISLTSSIDNGIGSTTKIPANVVATPKKPLNKKQQSPPPKTTNLAFDIVTNQGLADTDITQSVKTNPKKNLLRDPAERNIPRLIVDNSIIQQAVRTPRVPTTNLDNEFSEQAINYNQTASYNQTNHQIKPHANGYANGDLTNKRKSHDLTKKQTIKYVEDEQPIDDYWKKEVHIDDEGVVTIEPLKYDKNTYEGPFGLTRQGSFIFYIGMALFTLLAAVFLIMTGIFYSQNYLGSSSQTGVLVGLCVCALAFYLGLQLILIGLWHQKFRQENPRIIKNKSTRHNDSSAHLKTSMEESEPYDYSYPEQYDYAAYENYNSYPPYTSNTTEMLLQQPGAATGAGYYEPVVWPSNVQVETQPDPQFLQPMEISYGARANADSPSTAIGFASVSNPFDKNIHNDQTKSEKKSHRHHGRHHHNKKTVQAEPPKPKFDSIVPTSTVIEAPLPVFSKAPETNELLKSIAEAEKNTQPNSTRKNSNRIQPTDDGDDIISLNDHKHHHRDHQSRHHHQHQNRRHHRQYSYSSCSTCSSFSNDSYSDAGHGHHHYRQYQHQHSVPVEKISAPRPVRSQTRSPPRVNSRVYRNTGTGSKLHGKIMKNSGVTTDLEDVPNVRDNRLEQIPVVRRTIIVEPYPSEPTSQILIKPQSNTTGKMRIGKNQKLNGDNEVIISPSTTFMNKKTNKKKKTNEHNNEDLQLEDVNDDHNDETERSKSKNRSTSKTLAKKNVKNAFYD